MTMAGVGGGVQNVDHNGTHTLGFKSVEQSRPDVEISYAESNDVIKSKN